MPRLTAVPAKRSNAAVLKVRLYLVVGLLIFSALLGLFSTVAWFGSKGKSEIDVTQIQSKAQGSAEEAAREWLNGETLLVGRSGNIATEQLSKNGTGDNPGRFDYSSLSWDGFESDSLSDGRKFEIHHFIVKATVTGADGKPASALYRLSVTMLLSANGEAEPVLAAAPALESYIPGKDDYPFDYSKVADNVNLPSAVTGILNEWANAYAADDAAQLKLIVGDPESNAQYYGIPGFKSGKLSVVYALSFKEGDKPAVPKEILVRARVSLESANGFSSETEYDLLVDGADTGSPHVVAWGPAGSANRSDFLPYSFNRRPF